MKLSEDRIRWAAKAIAADLVQRGTATSKRGEDHLARVVGQALRERVQLDAEVDGEARGLVARKYKAPSSNSPQFQAELERTKAELVARRLAGK